MAAPNTSSSERGIYSEYHQKFQSAPLPQNEEEWLSRASEVSEIFSKDAAQRDIDNKSPHDEVLLLKSSGLLKLLGPKHFGGGGQSWNVGYKAIRENEQKDRFQKDVIENNYFIGGAVNPRDSDLNIKSDGDHIIFNGQKHFNTGGVVSDITILEGVLDGTANHIFRRCTNETTWYPICLQLEQHWIKLTESGSVKIENVRVPWTDALGWDAQTKEPLPQFLGVSLRQPPPSNHSTQFCQLLHRNLAWCH
ncbi:hypothetical protein DID88_009534 [Monilinia fructigena]|uniref:Uncharacterized protein n=1 Tax=Monilinia fructigena TaxID=38457 RepID=A0A395IMN2_9HELO|nr:hypothetical protein DID88_009534 [Monilinia fructigena]